MEQKYKKQCFILMVIILILLCLVCFKSLNDMATNNDNQKIYEGISQWGTSIVISIYKNTKDEIYWEYKESWDIHRGIWFTQSGTINDNIVRFDCEGNQTEEEYSLNYHYKGTLENEDNYIVLTFLEGEKTEIINGEINIIRINELESNNRSAILRQRTHI